MGMNLAKQSFSMEPEYLIAGTAIGITTGVKAAAAALEKGAPVILDANGKAAKVVVSEGVAVTTGLYGIVAEAAASGEDAIIYLSGEFFADALVLEEDVTVADLEVPFRNIGIFLKGDAVNP